MLPIRFEKCTKACLNGRYGHSREDVAAKHFHIIIAFCHCLFHSPVYRIRYSVLDCLHESLSVPAENIINVGGAEIS